MTRKGGGVLLFFINKKSEVGKKNNSTKGSCDQVPMPKEVIPAKARTLVNTPLFDRVFQLNLPMAKLVFAAMFSCTQQHVLQEDSIKVLTLVCEAEPKIDAESKTYCQFLNLRTKIRSNTETTTHDISN